MPSIKGNLVDIHQELIYPAIVKYDQGVIVAIEKITSDQLTDDSEKFILPGFIDSHVHIESSLLVPSEFAKLAVVHGTVATISDPHEIANVCGVDGVYYMIENGNTVPFKFNFGAPSCVPATIFETAGATVDVNDVESLLKRDDIKYLSEMMNFPGVLTQDNEVMEKIKAAHALGKPVDGHAPGLRGELAKQYISAGISTDHECFTAEEALDKLKLGMKILIREGSAARNFDALIDLLKEYPNQIMFCSDDKHPDNLVLGHINQLCARAIKKNIPLFNILKAACFNPVNHYHLNVGLLREKDPADFIIVNDLQEFQVSQTYINGKLVAEEGKSLIETKKASIINQFSCEAVEAGDFELKWNGEKEIRVIEALDGQLITNSILAKPFVYNGRIESDLTNDILKIVVVNRYKKAAPSIAFIKNFGLQAGALASSVAHDSHNIVAVGTDDESLSAAINMVIENQGGLSFASENEQLILPLPVAGLMSNEDGYRIAELYTTLDKTVKEAGSTLNAPFMTLSFMALLVIPHLKLSDMGLFDGDQFAFVNNPS